VQAIDFENEFTLDLKLNGRSDKGTKPYYLFDCQIQYIDFLQNIGVSDHQKVQRSEKHIKEIQKSLLLFNEALTNNKVNKKMTLIDRITDDHVGFYHTYLLKDKSYSSKTYNNKIAVLRSFFKWCIEKFDLNIYNPFEKVRARAVVVKKDTITQQEFNKLLEIISPENGHTTTGITQVKARNRYKPYLKDAIELALHTGGRREEVVDLTWNMITESNNEPIFITVRNLKVERQKGEGFNENVAPKIIPVTKSLKKLLYRMGYENKKGKEEFIISPDRSKTSTYALMDNLSKGFSHFYKQLGTGRDLQLKSLRKTYLTYLSAALSGNAKSLSSHTSNEVLQKHYIDEKIVSKAVKELNIFNS
jgi:integrase